MKLTVSKDMTNSLCHFKSFKPSWAIGTKRDKSTKSENKSEMHIILAHEFASFSSREQAYGFPCMEKKTMTSTGFEPS